MPRPTFSIVVPTKNRPDRLANTVRSALYQTFADLEVVVSDNSDPDHAEASAAAVTSLADPRIKYVRTNGRLSMPDNWEFGCGHATGEYVCLLTDRSVFRPSALQTVKDEIDRTSAQVVTWWCDHYGRDPSGKQFRRRHVSGARRRLTRDEVLNLYLHGDPKFAGKFLPKLMAACCHHSILDAIRRSAAGRCFLPVSPDYTSGLLILGFVEWTLLIEEALYVSCGAGNGASFRLKGALAQRFFTDLGLDANDAVDCMPTRAVFSHALCLNDYMRIKRLLPERYVGFDLDRVQYYIGCLNDYIKSAKQGADFTDELDVLIEGLGCEAADVQRAVRAHPHYPRAIAIRPNVARARIAAPPAAAAAGENGEPKGGALNPGHLFASVFDALAWDADHPRPLAPVEPFTAPRQFASETTQPWWERRLARLQPRSSPAVSPAAAEEMA